jgi:Fe-S-cluster-containing hydrogenase component 2
VPTPTRSSRLPHLGSRETIRLLINASLLVALWQFVRFAIWVSSAGTGAPPTRPTAADAFLPLAGVTTLKVWISSGRFDTLHPAALVVLLATLVTAWLFRRALCSWLCPIGLVSEYLARLGAKLMGRNVTVARWLDRTLLTVKYIVSLAIIAAVFGAPASAAIEFARSPYYAIADLKLFDVYSAFNLLFLVGVLAILVGSVFVKNLWCRYACPYGTLQGILGVLSPIRLHKDDELCTHCGRCTRVCPNGVDVASASIEVLSAECMGCVSCVEACPRKGALEMRVPGLGPVSRAWFGAAFLLVFFGIVVVAAVAGHWQSHLTATDYRAIVQVAGDVRLPHL